MESMITEASVLLRDEVRRYLLQERVIGSDTEVVLGNIATLENSPELEDKVVLTLINVEEESALKNGKISFRNSLANGVESIFPPVYLNLYYLFSASLLPVANDENYQKALRRISSIIELFQSKKTFTIQNSPAFGRDFDPAVLSELRLHPELYTMTFEQINHLWGSLGGKQSPFVMYKVRLVKLQRLLSEEAPLIETIDTNVVGLSLNPL